MTAGERNVFEFGKGVGTAFRTLAPNYSFKTIRGSQKDTKHKHGRYTRGPTLPPGARGCLLVVLAFRRRLREKTGSTGVPSHEYALPPSSLTNSGGVRSEPSCPNVDLISTVSERIRLQVLCTHTA